MPLYLLRPGTWVRLPGDVACWVVTDQTLRFKELTSIYVRLLGANTLKQVSSRASVELVDFQAA